MDAFEFVNPVIDLTMDSKLSATPANKTQITAQQYLSSWIKALRLPTLCLALATTLCGCVLAWQQQASHNLSIAVLTIVTALLLQILGNLANDYGDMAQGADAAKLLSGKTAHNLYISQTARLIAIVLMIFLSAVCGLYLLYLASKLHYHAWFWLIWVGLGVVSILAALSYTMGKRPYGYYGLGDLAVFIFFGLLAVCGAFYLNSGKMMLTVLWPATAVGLWCVAILNLNNIRDIQTDILAKKMTLAVKLGTAKARVYHLVVLSLALGCWSIYAWSHFSTATAVILIGAALVMLVTHLYSFFSQNDAAMFGQEIKKLSLWVLLQVILLAVVPYSVRQLAWFS